jgi:hypothetical protein
VGALHQHHRERPAEARPRGRLGDQVPLIEAFRARHDLPLGHAAGAAARPAVPRHLPRPQPVLQAAGPRDGRADVHRRRHRGRDRDPPQTTRARLRGEFIKRPRSASATTPSTGCTSSSTTRPSAPCSARTRSRVATSGSRSSSPPPCCPACAGPRRFCESCVRHRFRSCRAIRTPTVAALRGICHPHRRAVGCGHPRRPLVSGGP